MRHFSVVFMAVLSVAFATSSTEIFQELAKFCGLNGITYVTYFGSQLPTAIPVWNSAFGVRARILKNSLHYVDTDPMDTLVAIHEPNTKLDTLLDMLHQRKILRSILVIEEDSEADLIQSASAKAQNLFFYVLFTTKDFGYIKSKKQLITIKGSSQVVVNDLEIDPNGQVIEKYDLQRLHLVVTTLPWVPFIDVTNCNKKGRGCSSKGLLVDMMNIWAKDLNFTWDVYADVNNAWGLFPVSGPFNLSGEWTGVFGDVVTGLYPMSLNAWGWFLERNSILDFVHVLKSNEVLAVLPQPADFDPGLFIRPFTTHSWMGIGIMLVLGFSFLVVPYLFFKYDEEQVSKRIAIIACWLLFMLINAYYGGALTMFFVSEASLPFKTLKDVLKAFPDWKLFYQDGNEAYFQIPASQGDPDYIKYWSVASDSPENYAVPSVAVGVQRLKEPKTVLYVVKGMLTAAYYENPKTFPPLKTFGATRITFNNVILTKNSPLRPIFRQAATKLFERGQYDRLAVKWEGEICLLPKVLT